MWLISLLIKTFLVLLAKVYGLIQGWTYVFRGIKHKKNFALKFWWVWKNLYSRRDVLSEFIISLRNIRYRSFNRVRVNELQVANQRVYGCDRMTCKLQVSRQWVMICKPKSCESITLRAKELWVCYRASSESTNLWVTSLRAYELRVCKLTI